MSLSKKITLSVVGRRNKQQILKDVLRPGPASTVSTPSITTTGGGGTGQGCTPGTPGGTTDSCNPFDLFDRTYNGDGVTTSFGDADVTGYYYGDTFTNKSGDKSTVYSVAGGRATVDLTGATSARFAPYWTDARNFNTYWAFPGEVEFEYEVENATAHSNCRIFVDTDRSTLTIRPGLGTAALDGNDTSDSVSGLTLTGLQKCRLYNDGDDVMVKLWAASDDEPATWTMVAETSNEDYFLVGFDVRASATTANTKYHFDYLRLWGGGVEIDTCSGSEYLDGSYTQELFQYVYHRDVSFTDLTRNDLDTSWWYRRTGTTDGDIIVETQQDAYDRLDPFGNPLEELWHQSNNPSGPDATAWGNNIYARTYFSFLKPTVALIPELISVNSVKITGQLLFSVENTEARGPSEYTTDINLYKSTWGTGTPSPTPEPVPSDLVTTYEVTAVPVTGFVADNYNGATVPTTFDTPLDVPSGDYLQLWLEIENPGLSQSNVDGGHNMAKVVWSNEGATAYNDPDVPAARWTVTMNDPAPFLTITQASTGAARTVGLFTGSMVQSGGVWSAPVTPSYFTNVYFDGMKAVDGIHYTIDGDMGIVPVGTAPSEVIADYVVR